MDALVDGCPVAVVGLDADLRVNLANEQARGLFGGRKSDLLGRPWSTVVGEAHPGGPEMEAAPARALRTRQPVDLPDLTWGSRALHVHVVPVNVSLAGRGGCPHVVLAARDDTRCRRLEAEAVQGSKMQALGSLVSGIAHEINNPLAGIMGYTDLLLARPLPESVREDVLKIHNEVVRCQHVVEGLLAFARPHRPRRTTVDLNSLMRQTLMLLQYNLRVTCTSVREELDPDLGEVVGDPHQLQRVFLNLITNAVQAIASSGTAGVLTVRTRRRGAWVCAEVADTGPGMPAEHLERIFEPFFTTKGAGEGTGLGLSICAEIVRDHGGRIQAQSTVGQGTTFTVELPAGA